MIKKFLLFLLLLLVVIQFVRPKKNDGELNVPSDISHIVTVPEDVKSILVAACYDCHSNQTKYPWYSQIMPFGWWLNHHVEEGKEHLNFSEFASYKIKRQDHKLEETLEEVEEHEMPLESYLWLHPEAKLSDTQVQRLVEWAKKARTELPAQN